MKWIITSLLLQGIFTIISSGSDGIVRKNILENEDKGAVVANMAKIFGLNYDERAGRTFKLLSQILVIKSSASITQEVSLLNLNKNTGVITLAQELDREDLCESAEECFIQIQAVMLPNEFFTMLNMEIVIADVNDNSPEFPNREIDISISESDVSLGDVISLDKFRANDKDIGKNSEITYELSKNPFFDVETYEDEVGNSHLQFIVKEIPDYEETPLVELTLTATDGGDEPISDEVAVYVNILDSNDHDPVFDQQEYTAKLRENDDETELVITVHAVDEDSEEYGSVRYYIPKSSQSDKSGALASKLLSINKLSGEIHLKKKVDREIHDGLRVLVEARDSDPIKPRIGKTWLLINVEDINDNAPVIKVNFIVDSVNNTGYLPESADIKTYVAYMSATDVDNGPNGKVNTNIKIYGKHKLHKELRDLSEEFVLASDGLLATGRLLDREIYQYYIVKIKSCDGGSPSRCSIKNITLIVLDVNDNSPVFSSSAKAVMIDEDSKVGAYVINIRADDEDAAYPPSMWKDEDGEIGESRNGIVRYSIIQGDTDYFDIDLASGDVSLKKTLDHETQKEWRLLIEARDGGWQETEKANCSVVIRVGDVNDNQPKFVVPKHGNSEVYATILYDQLIMAVEAEDSDDGRNSKIVYRLLEEDEVPVKVNSSKSPMFIINPNNGGLRLNFSNVNLTDILGWHTVLIEASDSGEHPLAATTKINVKITDKALPDPLNMAGFDKKYILLASVLGSASCLLIIVIISIFMCRRRKDRKLRTYNCRSAENKNNGWISSSLQNTNESKMNESNYFQSKSIDDSTSTDAPTKSESIHGRNDVIVTHSMLQGKSNNQMRTFKVDTKHAVPTSMLFSSVRAADRDSGRGDSDSENGNFTNVDETVTQDQILQRLNERVSQRKTSQQDDESTRTSELGPQCDESCRKYGHSDTCWMPSPTSDSYHASNLPRHKELRYGMTASTPQLDSSVNYDCDGRDRRGTEYPTLQHYPSNGYYTQQPEYYRTMSPSPRQQAETYYHGYESELAPIEEMTPLNPPQNYSQEYDPDDVSAQTSITLSTSPRHPDEGADIFARTSSRSSLASAREYYQPGNQNSLRWDSRFYNPPQVQRTPIHISQPELSQDTRPIRSPIPRMTYPRLSTSSSTDHSVKSYVPAHIQSMSDFNRPSRMNSAESRTEYPNPTYYCYNNEFSNRDASSIRNAQNVVNDIDDLLSNQ